VVRWPFPVSDTWKVRPPTQLPGPFVLPWTGRWFISCSNAASWSKETNCGAPAALPVPDVVAFPANISKCSGMGVLIAANGGKRFVFLADLGVSGG
jgi:hypothetical protein